MVGKDDIPVEMSGREGSGLDRLTDCLPKPRRVRGCLRKGGKVYWS